MAGGQVCCTTLDGEQYTTYIGVLMYAVPIRYRFQMRLFTAADTFPTLDYFLFGRSSLIFHNDSQQCILLVPSRMVVLKFYYSAIPKYLILSPLVVSWWSCWLGTKDTNVNTMIKTFLSWNSLAHEVQWSPVNQRSLIGNSVWLVNRVGNWLCLVDSLTLVCENSRQAHC